MSNPLVTPALKASLPSHAELPKAYMRDEFASEEAFRSYVEEGLRPPKLEDMVSRIMRYDIEPSATMWDSGYHSAPVETGGQQAFWKKPRAVSASQESVNLRLRSGPALSIMHETWPLLKAGSEWFPGGQAALEETMRTRVRATGGAWATLARFDEHYPKKGDPPAPRPPTLAEVVLAGTRSGWDTVEPGGKWPVVPEEGTAHAVTGNRGASNGAPTFGKWGDPAADDRVASLATGIRQEISTLSYSGVGEWYKERMLSTTGSRPSRAHIGAVDPACFGVCFIGKAKDDVYSMFKVRTGAMRFYNVGPRALLMNVQVATQPAKREMDRMSLTNSVHSGMGFNLARGGAEKMVEIMDARLARSASTYVHVGDDTWLACYDSRGHVHMLSLDCTAFDLTQRSEVLSPIHNYIGNRLAVKDTAAAGLWRAMMRERLVVLASTVTVRMKHGGPSGMPLQSEVNDMLMDVLLQRLAPKVYNLLHEYEDETDKELVGAMLRDMVQEIAKGLALKVRLERWVPTTAKTLRGALRQSPFLFVGYYFYTEGAGAGRVKVFIDLPRQYGALAYPHLRWVRRPEVLELLEAMRIGSTLIGWGSAPEVLKRFFDETRHAAVKRLIVARNRVEALPRDLVEKAMTAESIYAGLDLDLKSIDGLLGALTKEGFQESIWLEQLHPQGGWPPPPPPIVERAVAGRSWADIVEEEEEVERQARGVPAARVVARALPSYPPRPPPTHPYTAANLGRPGPSAVWGPNRAPRDRSYEEVAERGSRRRPRRRNFDVGGLGPVAAYSDPEEEPSSDYEEEYYDAEETVRRGRRRSAPSEASDEREHYSRSALEEFFWRM